MWFKVKFKVRNSGLKISETIVTDATVNGNDHCVCENKPEILKFVIGQVSKNHNKIYINLNYR